MMLSNSWKVVAFLGLPGVAGGGLLPALIKLQERETAERKHKRSGCRKGEKVNNHYKKYCSSDTDRWVKK